jgi:hypothetical protein
MPSKKKAPPHPGEILYHSYLEPLGLSQKQFAKHLGKFLSDGQGRNEIDIFFHFIIAAKHKVMRCNVT